MSTSYFLSEIAEQDVETVVTELAQKNPQAAYDFIDVLYGAFDMLAHYPYMGHVREDFTDHPLRFWTFKWHYLVIYYPTQPLEIVRVLSGFRDMVSLLGDMR